MIGKGTDRVKIATDGEDGTIIVRETPFHAEGGGQLGDTGYMMGPMGKVEIHNTKRLPEGTVYHIGTVVEGSISDGEVVSFDVDTTRRLAMARNHTATHLLHAALKQVLGTHVNQAGSLVTPEYLRFDFTHFSPVTADELTRIEALVNEQILAMKALDIQEMSMEEAKAKGAMALFGDKYGDRVRVVTVPDFSVELCGGSHVPNTAVVGTFRITSDSGTGAGVRRIEAVTGKAAIDMAQADRQIIHDLAEQLKTKPATIVERMTQVLAESKETEHALAMAKKELAALSLDSILNHKFTVNSVTAVVASVSANDMNELRQQADMVRDTIQSGVVLLGAAIGDKVNFVCMATKDVLDKGIHAGNIVKAVAQTAGGNGGGRPDMAQAGGKNPESLEAALTVGKETICHMVK